MLAPTTPAPTPDPIPEQMTTMKCGTVRANAKWELTMLPAGALTGLVVLDFCSYVSKNSVKFT
jgi:hypothetical protein